MVQTGKPSFPWNLAVEGTLLCMPDIWGNRFPPPESEVWFRTSDLQYIQTMRKSTFGMIVSDPSGQFTVTSMNHPKIISPDTYFLEIKNTVTGQIQNFPISPIAYHKMATVMSNSHIQLGEVHLPWTPVVPVIAKINGREFKYPGDVSRTLLQQFKGGGTAHIELIGSFAGQPAPDERLDSLLSVIESESHRPGTSAKVTKFLSEVSKAARISMMQVRKPLDVVNLVLDKYSNTRYNTQNIKEFSSMRFDLAVRSAFGIASPFFLMLYGRAAFSLVLFTAGCVARGQRISVTVTETMADHITSVSVL